jgi:2-methylcitrate dehydratase
MTAIGLLKGTLTADDYEDAAASDPRIDQLRSRMQVVEAPAYTRDYLDPQKRSIGNAVQVFFKDGTHTDKVAVEYPVGHRRRRAEGEPLLIEKFKHNIATRFDAKLCDRIYAAFSDAGTLDVTPIDTFMDYFAVAP